MYQSPASKIPIYNCIRSSFRHHLFSPIHLTIHIHTFHSYTHHRRRLSLCSAFVESRRERLHFWLCLSYTESIQNSIPIGAPDPDLRIWNQHRIWIDCIWIVHFPVSLFTPFLLFCIRWIMQFSIYILFLFIFSVSARLISCLIIS